MQQSNIKNIIFLTFFLPGTFLQAQSIHPTDTIETARQLSYSKNYIKAINLLRAFEFNHPEEINSVRLHAQILYWMNDNQSAFNLFEIYLRKHPNNKFIQLDYARMLFELNKLKKAKEVLADYSNNDKSNVEVNNMLGTIAYWDGRPGLAKFYFGTVLKKYPGNEWAQKYINEIKRNASPFINIKSGYIDDIQPLQSINLGLETGWFASSWFNPGLNFQIQHFIDTVKQHNFYSFQLANKFSLLKIKTDVRLTAGVFKSQSGNNINGVGGLEIDTKLFKNLTISASAERKPYLYTLSSLDNSTIQNSYTASLTYFKESSWSGKAAYNVQQFSDHNYVNTFSSWLLAPPLHLSTFAIRIGYGNNFSNSKENRF